MRSGKENRVIGISDNEYSPEGFARMERDPERLMDFAFNSHPEAYLNGGLSALDLWDAAMVLWEPDKADIIDLDSLKQIATVLPTYIPELIMQTIALDMGWEFSFPPPEIMKRAQEEGKP